MYNSQQKKFIFGLLLCFLWNLSQVEAQVILRDQKEIKTLQAIFQNKYPLHIEYYEEAPQEYSELEFRDWHLHQIGFKSAFMSRYWIQTAGNVLLVKSAAETDIPELKGIILQQEYWYMKADQLIKVSHSGISAENLAKIKKRKALFMGKLTELQQQYPVNGTRQHPDLESILELGFFESLSDSTIRKRFLDLKTLTYIDGGNLDVYNYYRNHLEAIQKASYEVMGIRPEYKYCLEVPGDFRWDEASSNPELSDFDLEFKQQAKAGNSEISLQISYQAIADVDLSLQTLLQKSAITKWEKWNLKSMQRFAAGQFTLPQGGHSYVAFLEGKEPGMGLRIMLQSQEKLDRQQMEKINQMIGSLKFSSLPPP